MIGVCVVADPIVADKHWSLLPADRVRILEAWGVRSRQADHEVLGLRLKGKLLSKPKVKVSVGCCFYFKSDM